MLKIYFQIETFDLKWFDYGKMSALNIFIAIVYWKLRWIKSKLKA